MGWGMYRHRKNGSQKYEWAVHQKEAKRLEGPTQDYPSIPNTTEPVIEIYAKHNLLGIYHEYKAYRTLSRCDSLDLFVDGNFVERCGRTRIFELMRLAWPRIGKFD